MRKVPKENDPIPVNEHGKPLWIEDIEILMDDFCCGLRSEECIRYALAQPKAKDPNVTGADLYNLAMHKAKDIINARLN